MTDLLEAPADRRLQREPLATDDTPAPWLRAAILPTLAVIALGALLPLVAQATGVPRHGDVAASLSLAGECVFGAVVFAVALPIARRNGGWGKALGLTRPTGADSGPFFATTGIQLGLRFFLGIVLVLLVPALRHEHVSNLTGVGQLGPVGIVMLVIAACIVAPIVEELAFRGVMLRAIMRRISFWPAAVLSSLVFGLLHAPTAPNAAGVVVVIMLTFVFGVVQCVLVRRTGRLAPAIGVHAITNAIALAIALAAASS